MGVYSLAGDSLAAARFSDSLEGYSLGIYSLVVWSLGTNGGANLDSGEPMWKPIWGPIWGPVWGAKVLGSNLEGQNFRSGGQFRF